MKLSTRRNAALDRKLGRNIRHKARKSWQWPIEKSRTSGSNWQDELQSDSAFGCDPSGAESVSGKNDQKQGRWPSFEIFITLSFAGKTGIGATTGKIPGPAKFLAKCHVFGIFLVNLKTIFSKPTFCQITHCNYKLLHYQNNFQTFMNVVGEWISQWVVYFFTGDLFKYYPFAP